MRGKQGGATGDTPHFWLELSDAWSSVVADDTGVILGRIDGDGAFRVMELGWEDRAEGVDGGVILRQGEPGGWVAALRGESDALFAHSYDGVAYTLWDVDLSKKSMTERVRSEDAPIHGPVRVGDTLWIVSGGRLGRLTADNVVWEHPEYQFDCIGEHRDSAYVCIKPDLWQLDANGLGSAPWFEVAKVSAPSFDDLENDTANRCRLDWEHFAGEADINPDTTLPDAPSDSTPTDTADAQDAALDPSDPPQNASDDCACRAVSGNKTHPIPPLLLSLLAFSHLRAPPPLPRSRHSHHPSVNPT